MKKLNDTFTIDSVDARYLHIDIEALATLIIKRDDEGIILDLYPFHRLESEPVATTWAHEHDILDDAEESNDPNNESTPQ